MGAAVPPRPEGRVHSTLRLRALTLPSSLSPCSLSLAGGDADVPLRAESNLF